jgi:LPXTG-site transpeptidase (sortase) family protein
VPGALRWAEHLLLAIGGVLLAASALFVADAALSQRAARQSLQAMARVDVPTVARATAAAGVRHSDPPLDVRAGSPIGELSIARLGLSAIVLQGSDARTLLHGPGQVEHTALPGEAGNAVIAGHRDSFFRLLRDVRIGDDVMVDMVRARFQYRVTSLRVVHPYDLSVLQPTKQATLTLITCYPFWVLGRAPDRFVVRAVRVDAATANHLAEDTSAIESPRSLEAPPPPITGVASLELPFTADDDTLVRHSIERFRLTYNARLASHNEGTPLGPQTCDVVIAADGASASCTSSSPARDGADSERRDFSLERVDDGWAIRSVVVGAAPHSAP